MDEQPNDLQTKLAAMEKQVAALTEAAAKRELAATLHVTDESQLSAIRDVQRAHAGLTPQQARAAAAEANPSLFSAPDPRGFIAGQHASLRPTLGGGPPAPPTLKEEAKAIAAHRLVNPMQTDTLEKQLHGRLLRQALIDGGAPGWK